MLVTEFRLKWLHMKLFCLCSNKWEGNLEKKLKFMQVEKHLSVEL